jgi:D-alanyl-D-alanine carboxypeptidase/D-alanyl-D-alanine-endopeptidase (penicillin-binding protein 4)
MRSLFVVLSLCCCLPAFAGTSVSSPRLADREALKKAVASVIEHSALKTARVTVQIRSAEDGSVVFERDADELLNPASNVKLYTAATALARLGPDYRYDTEFLTDTELKTGKAKVLYVRGKGDPTITTERLYAMTMDLVHAGLKEVTGDLVLDDTFFDAERTPPGFDQETGDKAYLASPGALSLNWNTVGVYLRPGENVGDKATAELEPASDYFTLTADQLTTGTKTQRHYTVTIGPEKDRVRQKIEVQGSVPLEKGTWTQWKKVENPALYFGFTLKALLAEKGIKVKGRVRQGQVPPGARMLAVSQSDTLDIVLKRLNKHSNNFVAEQLIKTLGAEVVGAPGTTEKGIEAVEQFLAKDVGIPRGTYVMKNGSGLNDTNRFSAAQTTKLLLYMLQRLPLMPEYISSLGIAGKDGTLKYRFEGSEAVGRLRAKTGTLENVSALSGYVQAVGGERFVFSVMVNDFPGRVSSVLSHIDSIGAAIAAVGTPEGPAQAVAAMTQQPSVVGSADELEARMKTYVAFAQKADRRNAPFLRTTWRSEKDPAVRALIADALYQSDPREGSAVRAFLDSALPSEDVFGRVQRTSQKLGFDVPLLSSLVELSASGNLDALGRLFEFIRAVSADEQRSALLAEQLTVVAHDAPTELILALKVAPVAERTLATEALAKGLVRTSQPAAAFWNALKQSQQALDPTLVEYAKALEVELNQRLAEARAAPAAPVPEVPAPKAAAQGPAVQPGG